MRRAHAPLQGSCNLTILQPATSQDVRDACTQSGVTWIVGMRSKETFSRIEYGEGADTLLDLSRLSGIIEHHADDLVVEVLAGTSIAELQAELALRGQCLPLPNPSEKGLAICGFPGTVGGLLAMNLPHGLYGACGGPRDWLLGCTVLRASGDIVHSGSRVVKSVAGYDAHQLFVGTRGIYGVILQATLRTYPLASLPACQATMLKDVVPGRLVVQRVARTDFDPLCEQVCAELIAFDGDASTVWYGGEPIRFDDDWVILGSAVKPNENPYPEPIRELRRITKRILDPEGKWNPGAIDAGTPRDPA